MITEYSNEYLDSMRMQTDPPADEAIALCFADSGLRQELRTYLENLHTNKELLDITPPVQLSPLVSRASVLPVWATKKQMAAGSAFFSRHAQIITQLLGLLSLPFCYAAADGARVLHLSELIRNNPGKRLLDTAEYVWDIMAPDAFEAQGKGFASILKIRIIHAGIRYYTLKKEWNLDWGKPINQEDMAGTNLALSLVTIRGMRKLGLTIAYSDQQAFIHLWNVTGFLSGIQPELLPAEGRQVSLLEQTIRKRQFKNSVQGTELTKSLTEYYQSVNPGTAQEFKLRVLPLMRFLLGTEAADILNLPAPELSPRDHMAIKILNSLNDLKFGSENEYQEQKRNFEKFSRALKVS